MICKGCGNQIPKGYLSIDSFKCPYCNKVYHRKSPQQLSSIEHQKGKIHQTTEQTIQSSQMPKFSMKSFLQKHWYIFAALIILLVVAISVNSAIKESSTPSITSTIDGTWKLTGYVNFETLQYEGKISSKHDWKDKISNSLVETPSSTSTISIFNGTIVDMYGNCGTISINPLYFNEFDCHFESDGEGYGWCIAKCGKQLHLMDKGELYIYTAAKATLTPHLSNENKNLTDKKTSRSEKESPIQSQSDIISAAKNLFEQTIYSQGMYNNQYSDIDIEYDGHNRYIVAFKILYEDSKRNYKNCETVLYFWYSPKDDHFHCDLNTFNHYTFIKYGITREWQIEHLKKDTDINWGGPAPQ